MNRYIMEFIGTFFLVLTVGATALLPGGAGNLAPLAIGSVLMVMIFAGGHISGGHFNPAVTLAVYLRGKCPSSDVLPYMAAQVAGASLAAGVVILLAGPSPSVPPGPDVFRGLLAEFLFTFAVCTVVLQTATSKGTSGNSFYGLAIGFTVTAGAYAVGPVSGAVFNPAVAVGITIMGLSGLSGIWIYLIATFAASFAAARVFRITNPGDAA